jgi:hypothetical protein
MKHLWKLGWTILALVGMANQGHGFTVNGVEFTDYLLFDVPLNSDFQLATTGDIYVLAPHGLSAISIDIEATDTILGKVVLSASDTVSVCAPFISLEAPQASSTPNLANTSDRSSQAAGLLNCVDLPATIFQDVVLRVSGSVGAITLDSGRSIVLDAVPVPVPEPRNWALIAIGILAVHQTFRSRNR